MKTDRKDGKNKQPSQEVLLHNQIKKVVDECVTILSKAYDKVIDKAFDEAFTEKDNESKRI